MAINFTLKDALLLGAGAAGAWAIINRKKIGGAMGGGARGYGDSGREVIFPPEQVPWAVQGKARPPRAPRALKHGRPERSERFTVLPPPPPPGLSGMFGDPIDDKIEMSSPDALKQLRADLLAVIKSGQHRIDMGGETVLVPVVLGKVNARLKSLAGGGYGGFPVDPIDPRNKAAMLRVIRTYEREAKERKAMGEWERAAQLQLKAEKLRAEMKAGVWSGGLAGFSGTRWTKFKGGAGRALKAARGTAKTSGVRMIKGQIANVAGAAKIVMGHPEVLAGKISPALVKDLVEGGFIQRSAPAEMYKTAKDFVSQYRSGLGGFAGDSGLTCNCRGKTVVKPMQLRFVSCDTFCKGR